MISVINSPEDLEESSDARANGTPAGDERPPPEVIFAVAVHGRRDGREADVTIGTVDPLYFLFTTPLPMSLVSLLDPEHIGTDSLHMWLIRSLS